MGLFDLIRRLDEAAANAARAATQEARRLRGDHQAIAAFGWDNAGDPGLVMRFYQAAAEDDPEIALAVARIDAIHDGQVLRAVIEEGVGAAAPYAAALLGTDRRGAALHLAMHAYPAIGRRLTGLEALAESDESHTRHMALLACAGSPYPEDRRIAAERLARYDASRRDDGNDDDDDDDNDDPPVVVQMRCRLAAAGDAGADDWIVATLEAAARARREGAERAVADGEPRYLSRDDYSAVALVAAAAADRGREAAVPHLAALVSSFDALEVCEALGRLGGGAATRALADFRRRVAGDRAETAPFHLAADAALARLGEPADLELARWALESIEPRHYGYPKVADVAQLHALAARVLVERGEAADLERLRPLLHAPFHALRSVASNAVARLEGAAPRLDYYDPPRVTAMAGDPERLLAALESPIAVFRENLVAAALADETTRDRAAAWARRALEARPNHRCQYQSDAGPEVDKMLDALGELEDDDKTRLLEGTTSAWIQAFVIDEDDMERALPTSELAPGVELEVERFDAGGAAFTYGNHVNGLAISPDGSRFALVGQSMGNVYDAATGALLSQLDLRWSWGYDCAFSGDGETLLCCYHGMHVESYDAASGARKTEYEIERAGVPDGSKRCAVSPDDRLAVSVDSEGQVSCHELATGRRLWTHRAADGGSYEAVAFTPDGAALLASHVKVRGGEENYLTVHDLESGAARRIDIPSSMWAVAFSPDGSLAALGGESGRVLLCDPQSFEVERELSLAKTTRLVFAADGATLYGASQTGELRAWNLADADDAEGTMLLEGEGPLWALAVPPGGGIWAVGTQGTVFRFDAAGERIAAPEAAGIVHNDQVRWIEVEGEHVLTAGWDGQLLRWPRGGGSAEALFSIDCRINAVARFPDGGFALASGEALVVLDERGAELSRKEGDHDAVAVSRDGSEIAVDESEELVILEAATLEEKGRVVVGTDSVEAICALEDGWLVSTEQGEVSRVRRGARSWTIADHGADRLERGNPHKSVSSLVLTAGGFVSGATDDTVRVYRFADDGTAEQTLRIHPYDFSLFSRMDASDGSRYLAVPDSYSLEIFDLESGARRCRVLSYEHFERQEGSAVRFAGGDELLLGTESGAIFRVRVKGAMQ